MPKPKPKPKPRPKPKPSTYRFVAALLLLAAFVQAQTPFLYKEVAAAVPQANGQVAFYLTNGTTQVHHVESLTAGPGYCQPCPSMAWWNGTWTNPPIVSVSLEFENGNAGICDYVVVDNPEGPDVAHCIPKPKGGCSGFWRVTFVITGGWGVLTRVPGGAWATQMDTFITPVGALTCAQTRHLLDVAVGPNVVELWGGCATCRVVPPSLTTGTLTNYLILDGK